MERQIMSKHEDSEELTDMLTQLEKHGIKQVGSIEREDYWPRLAGSGLNKASMNPKNYSYGIVLSTLPDIDFHTKVSHWARTSRCYEYYGKGKDNVIDGQKYYDFIQDLTSRIALPKGWEIVLPEFMGFAMDEDSFSGTTVSYYGHRGRFELCKSLSLAEADPDRTRIKKGVIGGVLGKGSYFGESPSSWSGHKWQHLGDGIVLFPVYRPAVIGRMYHEGKIRTKREFVDSNEDPVDVSESSKNINCLEVIAIYPDKKVLDVSKDIGNGLVKAFLTYHPNYQFQWSKAAEVHAYNYELSLRKDK